MSPRREPCICGIDPGSVSGAIAFYSPGAPEIITAEDLPVVGDNIDASELSRRLLQLGPDFVVLERVSAMPKQGVSSVFNFGTAYGIIQGVTLALDIPLHLVSPRVWKKNFNLNSDGEKSRELAIRMWPAGAAQFSRKKDHNRAEAALIALYGVRFLSPVKQAAE